MDCCKTLHVCSMYLSTNGIDIAHVLSIPHILQCTCSAGSYQSIKQDTSV